MWPTFFIPSVLRAALRNCWDYLVGSGTTTHYANDGPSADPDITFAIRPGHTYRVIGRITFGLNETVQKAGSPQVLWDIDVPVTAVMNRSSYRSLTTPETTPTAPGSGQKWQGTADTVGNVLTVAGVGAGVTTPQYSHLMVDLFIAAGASAGTVSLSWGCTFSNPGPPARLTADTLLTVKEYPV